MSLIRENMTTADQTWINDQLDEIVRMALTTYGPFEVALISAQVMVVRNLIAEGNALHVKAGLRVLQGSLNVISDEFRKRVIA